MDYGALIPLVKVKWGEFYLNEIFDITPTKNGIDKIKLAGHGGDFPYITRTELNNGVNSFVNSQDDYIINSGNCITVGLDTQTAFYQDADFYTGQNIQVLRNKNLNEYNAKFIIPMLKNTLSIFNWGGNGATLTRLKRSRIILPVDKNNNPDYKFMEEYVKNIEAELLTETISQLKIL